MHLTSTAHECVQKPEAGVGSRIRSEPRGIRCEYTCEPLNPKTSERSQRMSRYYVAAQARSNLDACTHQPRCIFLTNAVGSADFK